MQEILSEIISLMVGGVSGIAEGVGQGFSTFAQNIMIVSGADGAQALSTFGAFIAIFAGISLMLGLIRWVLNFLTSLGARNR